MTFTIKYDSTEVQRNELAIQPSLSWLTLKIKYIFANFRQQKPVLFHFPYRIGSEYCLQINYELV